jgi:transcriptional regulator CtsR
LDFIKYKYKIRLGFRNWEIATMSGKTITIDNIVKDLKGKYDKEFIEPIIDEWFENQVINQSEKIILNFK